MSMALQAPAWTTVLATIAFVTSAAAADTVVLTNGERLVGTIVDRSDEQLVLQHPRFGRVPLAAGEVAAVIPAAAEPQPGEPPAEVPVEQAPAAEPPAEAAAAEPPADPWSFSIEFGLSGSQGNSETLNLRFVGEANRKTDASDLTFDAGYFLDTSDGETTKNQFTAGVRHDWLFADSPWLLFAQGRYDYDEFESWDHRVNGGGGVGYRFLEGEPVELVGRVGVGAVREWGSNNDDIRPEAILGLDLTWTIDERQTFAAGTTLYPDLSELGEFRTVSYADYSVLVDEQLGMSVKAGVEHEYQSITDPGKKEHDIRFYTSMVFEF